MEMQNRVYGIECIKARRSNWNANFNGIPRTQYDNTIVASDKALKYADRRLWSNNGNNVFYLKSLNENMNPRTLKERYESMFSDLKKEKNQVNVMKNLLSCIDVLNFGATFTESDYNFSITGAVQIHQGYNIYNDSHIETLQILSPFRNPNNKKKKDDSEEGKEIEIEKSQSTVGTFIVADMCHYVYPFSINPHEYEQYKYIEGFEGYSSDAYEQFKDASCIGVTALNSVTKAGCDNEMTLFIELKDDSKLYIPSLMDFIRFESGETADDLITYDLSNLKTLNDCSEDIKDVLVYYNPITVNLKGLDGLKFKITKHNIFTKQVIK